MYDGPPKIAIVGNGRSGKDTAAEWLRDHTNLRHTGSLSDTAKPLLSLVLRRPIAEVFEKRHLQRLFWKSWLDAFRNGTTDDLDTFLLHKEPVPEEVSVSQVFIALESDPGLCHRRDPAKLIRLHLMDADVVPGVRGAEELTMARDQGLLDLIIWVENPRVSEDPTVDFRRGDADIVVLNDADVATFYFRLRRLAKQLHGLRVRS